MAYKRILTIQDISCVGQCSMTVALPVLSACGHETCILPTALLSTHTGGFGAPSVLHFDEALDGILSHWQRCGIRFDAVLVGYLGSKASIRTVMEIAGNMLEPEGILIVDPAMADNGKMYAGFDLEYAEAMRELCRTADIILPNITEAALLSGLEYREKLNNCYVNQLLDELACPCVVLTGVGYSGQETGVVLKEGENRRHYAQERIGAGFHGTGDLFAACFTGCLMQGKTKFEAVQIAADFTKRCIEETVANPAHWYGVKFETVLPELMKLLQV